ncbi:TerD family protein [Streptomyces sp. NPDC001728]|uniref:TerD family protein n=1 Tax=Streptomyces sp. NPDC001728 TaxID=3154396 RepID=UPI00332B5408
MTHIAKGANVPVPLAPLRIAVGRHQVPGGPVVDAAALLLDADGVVRGDADIVFHGLPAHPSGSVRHLGSGEGGGQLAEWLEADLPQVEPAVQRVLVVGSCDGGVFGQVPGLCAQVVAADGAVLAHYDVTDASSETAFVLGEFYRREGGWKFRAVGQGYDTGLAGLATDFGVVLADAAAPVAPPTSAPPAPPASVPVAPPTSAPPAPPASGPAAPPTSGPIPLLGVCKTASAPVPPAAQPAPASASTFVPSLSKPAAPASFSPVGVPTAPSPFQGPGFLDFEPIHFSGKSGKTVTVDLPFPPGSAPVILEARVEEYQFLHVEIPGRSDDIFCTELPDYYSRALLVPPRKGGPLKLKVGHSGTWALTVLPLSAARPITTGTVRGSGREVFLHTGPAAQLKVRAADRHNGWFQLNHHQGDAPADLRRPAEELVHAWNGRRVKEKVQIPAGPLLLVIDKSRHHWEFTLDPLPVGR